MDPHQARMGFAQAVDNSLIPGKLLFHVQEKHIYIYWTKALTIPYCIEHALLQEWMGFVFWTMYEAQQKEKKNHTGTI